jgi:DNA (cytosine-5)-methyltransferase 1
MPRIFLLENVPPLANDASFRGHIEELVERGYSISRKIVNYSDFGAPTKRRRFIVFGSREENSDEFFRKLSNQTCRSRTVKDAIWDLRKKRKGEVPDHFWPELRTINKYRGNYENGKFGWYILKWEEPAPSFGNVMKTYILHPDASNGGPTRVISVKEALLIMGFDETFHFPEGIGMGMRYQMVADSVSPVFSLAAAKVIEGMLSDQD